MANTPPPASAAQIATLGLGHDATMAVGILAAVLAYLYEKFLRKHMPRVIAHATDIVAVLLALDAGIALAASWLGTWARALFQMITGLWNRDGRSGGSQWATIAAVALFIIVGAAIASIAKREHRGPLGGIFATAIALPLVLAATSGKFGTGVMAALVTISHPSLTFLGTW